VVGTCDRLTIVVSGMIAAVPFQGGATWAVLQYLLGLRRLGHDVFFVEQLDPGSLLPEGASLESSQNAAYLDRVAADYGLDGRTALLSPGSGETYGIDMPKLRALAKRSDVLLNISGTLSEPELLTAVPKRVYLDLDPAFNQLWQEQGIDMRFEGHTHFVTVGQAIGSSECAVPTSGRSWIPTLPPVVMEHWPPADRTVHRALTTVGHWRGYGSVEQDGVHYGQKAHSLRRFMSLPTRTDTEFLLALAIHPGEERDIEALRENGWRLADAAEVARTPSGYEDFVRESWAEFGIAKSGYVLSRCGWFSDRSACYLASARPVIAQETGFSRFLPTGEGLFSFETSEDVLAAVEELERDYARHSRAARELAEQWLDSDRLLGRLLDSLGEES
jgi:hypothetical protein